MRLLAIDPGTTQSAWLIFRGGVPCDFGISTNDELVKKLLTASSHLTLDRVVIEEIQSYGMAVGREVFETVRWAGRFEQAAEPVPVALMPRRRVKLAICGDSRANDANIRAALIDRYGGKAAAIGTKAAPGPLHGISKDVWSALAIAVTYQEEKA